MLVDMTALARFLALYLLSSTLAAEPAPFWQWRSKLDGKLACSQVPLGSGWEKVSGPYRDSRCEKRIVAK